MTSTKTKDTATTQPCGGTPGAGTLPGGPWVEPSRQSRPVFPWAGSAPHAQKILGPSPRQPSGGASGPRAGRRRPSRFSLASTVSHAARSRPAPLPVLIGINNVLPDKDNLFQHAPLGSKAAHHRLGFEEQHNLETRSRISTGVNYLRPNPKAPRQDTYPFGHRVIEILWVLLPYRFADFRYNN